MFMRFVGFIYRLLIVILFTLALSGCKTKREQRKIENSFYYWKSVFKLSDFEKSKLAQLEVKTIYIKYFDVDWDEQLNKPIPKAKLRFENFELPAKIQIIPTVFITNACIQKIDSLKIETLAGQILELINTINKEGEVAYKTWMSQPVEIQIDCDWTQSTGKKYFHLLNIIKSKIKPTALSCTIRLHQIKYLTKSGVPPVNRGLLMCYNMGNLKDPTTKNSILETTELEKYVGQLSNYPLPLDIALPLFEWKVLFRNNFYNGLIQNFADSILTNSFTLRNGNRFQILKDTILLGYDLRNGDMLRNEQSTISEILSTTKLLNKRLKNTSLRVSLYHLDSVILNKYTTHELESIYNSLN